MTSEVFFSSVQPNEWPGAIASKLRKLFEQLDVAKFLRPDDLVALKTHFGEEGNTTHISPDHVRVMVDLVKACGAKPFLTETSVLYKSRRMNAVSHILLAYEHGFSFDRVGAPIIMADGLRGNLERDVDIQGDCYQQVSVAADAFAADFMLLLSHPTGHLGAGLGAALKNLGMGLSSRKGKLNQHSASKPFVKAKHCTACGACFRHCPADALEWEQDKARILDSKCIGCGECITVCKFNAIGFRWDGASEDLQRKMAEHAWGVAKEMKGKIVFFNFLLNMTQECDCLGASEVVLPDIGLLASWDPVAIDLATLDLTREKAGRTLTELSHPELNPMIQIDHGVKLGMGNKDYQLIQV